MPELLLTELVDKLTHEMAVLKRLKFAATSDKTKAQPKREALPANLPRVEVHHEPDGTVCDCGCAYERSRPVRLPRGLAGTPAVAVR